ncbi:MAG: HTH domain-containing protein [Candidatus Rokubacteria bacterium]|nr:HTH domain-containing protein [Candidatus Rokubacteria bacterium]
MRRRRAGAITRRARQRGRRGAQLHVLLGMLRRLTSDHWSAGELAADLRMTRRTAWRYLAAIRTQCPLERARGEGQDHATYYRLPRRWWEA